MRKNAVLAQFEVLLCHLPEWSEENGQTSTKITGLRFLNRNFPNKKQNCKQLNHNFQDRQWKKD
jgi:hypothetical protein